MIDNLLVGLQMMAVGMTGVFVVLTFFYGIMELLMYIDTKVTQKNELKAAQAAAGSRTKGSKVLDLSDNPELIAVLSSAIVIALGKNVRIQKVTSPYYNNRSNTWASLGRQILLNSHKLK